MPNDLQVFPIALPGGINQGNAIPTEADLDDLFNFVPYRGRLSLRGPIVSIATVLDDQGSPASVEAILDIIEHQDKLWTLSWSSITDKVYLHSMNYDGSSLTMIGVVWSAGVTTKPTAKMVAFEGGTAEAGTARVYITDYAGVLTTRYWNGTTIADLTNDFDNNGAAETVEFSLMQDYKYHLFGTGYFEDGAAARPEMFRISQPGLVPCEDPGGGLNPKEWASLDHRSVGRRGDKIRATGRVGDRMLVMQRKMAHAVFGTAINNFNRQELSPTVGCVGPYALTTADNKLAYFWSMHGPYRTDGSEVQYIGDPIQAWIPLIDAHELHTRAVYSPHDGIVHFIVSLAGVDNYSLHLMFDHRAGRWMRAELLVGTSTKMQVGGCCAASHTTRGQSIYLGERAGARVMRLSRVGFDSTGQDLSTHVYTGTFRTERIAPAGSPGLINFRRVVVHVYAAGTYEVTMKVWVDGVRTTLGDGTTQTIVLNRAASSEIEYNLEGIIEAYGNNIQVELNVDSNDVTAPFYIESITAHGRVIRGTASRTGDTT